MTVLTKFTASGILDSNGLSLPPTDKLTINAICILDDITDLSLL